MAATPLDQSSAGREEQCRQPAVWAGERASGDVTTVMTLQPASPFFLSRLPSVVAVITVPQKHASMK